MAAHITKYNEYRVPKIRRASMGISVMFPKSDEDGAAVLRFKMADVAVRVSQQQTNPIKIKKWKIRQGTTVPIGRIILIYEVEDGGKPEQKKLKATQAGIIHKILAREGNVVQPGEPLYEIKACSHPTIMNDMCAECGADLRKDDSPITTASVPMIHAIPELKVSEEQAKKIGKADNDRLIKDRKLVLLVDLDQTLIHTTNDNIPPNIKDVYHFQLYGPKSPWYHTRLRPGTHKFLESICEFYELHICTFGARNYAHMIAMFLDPEQKFFSNRILSRDECFDPTSKKANLRALFPCGDDMVCIIDDREDVWSHASNLIHVKPYHFFQHTGDINAPPGLDKHENDDKQGVDLMQIVRQHSKEENIDKKEHVDEKSTEGLKENTKEVKGDEDKNAESKKVDEYNMEMDVPNVVIEENKSEEVKGNDKNDESKKVDECNMEMDVPHVVIQENKSEEVKGNDKNDESKKVDECNMEMDVPHVVIQENKSEEVKGNDKNDESKKVDECNMEMDVPNVVIQENKSEEVKGNEEKNAESKKVDECNMEMDVPNVVIQENKSEETKKIIQDEVCKEIHIEGNKQAENNMEDESIRIEKNETKEVEEQRVSQIKESKVELTNDKEEEEAAVEITEKEEVKTVTTTENGIEEQDTGNKEGDSEKDKVENDNSKEDTNDEVRSATVKEDNVSKSSDKEEPKITDKALPTNEKNGKLKNVNSTPVVEQEKVQIEDNLIEIEDPDDYLEYLEDVLQRIHRAFYERYDNIQSGKIPDLKNIIPSVRGQVLEGCKLVFSGLVPTHYKLEQSKAYQVARSLGADVQAELDDETTHLVAVRPGTAKVNAGRRKKNLKIVTSDWLWCCAERWEHVDERIFPLNSRGSRKRHPPPHCSSPEHVTSYPEHETPALRKRTPSGRFMDTINPLMSFSSDDIADMDKEVEDILDDESDDSEGEQAVAAQADIEEEDENDTDIEEVNFKHMLQTEILNTYDKDQNYVEQEALKESESDGEISKANAVVDDLKRKRLLPEDESSQEDLPSRKFRRGERVGQELDLDSEDPEENDSDSFGAPDESDDGEWNMMGAALEREFLSDRG